jgi:DNA-binding NarL/FixJ family response regulator
MERKTRLLIADNHRIMADAYKHLLEPEFEIVSTVSDGRALLDSVQEVEPDGVILEVFLPHLNGLDAADLIKSSSSSPKLIFVTANSDPKVAAEAFRRGASAYVLKQSGAEEFKKAIRFAMDGRSYLSNLIARETVDYLLHQWAQGRLEKAISPRQAEILQLLVEGNSMKRVADILAISPGTVAFHKYTLMKELRIVSNAELLQYAMKNHMVPNQTMVS